VKNNIVYLVLVSLILLLPFGVQLVFPGSEGTIGGIQLEFILFAFTLLGIALYHRFTLYTALAGLVSVVLFKVIFQEYPMLDHLYSERIILINLLGLLTGFALMSSHFEESGVPLLSPGVLPGGWKGPFLLLVLVFLISIFLDNIAAAMIGGTLAYVIFQRKVHVGYIAAIVAASNAGGAGSVVGDTTTTMMWIEGVPVLRVLHAYLAAVPALLFFGFFAARQQYALQSFSREVQTEQPIHYRKIAVVVMTLAGAILANVYLRLPAAGIWAALLVGALFNRTNWRVLPVALHNSVFLLSLVFMASLMPVEKLPDPSALTALFLGVVSSVFDNIPLTKLALDQNHYDWGLLAYTVGFGGSMIWFGSSAGVAITGILPEARSVAKWVKSGWHVLVAYLIGYLVLYGTLGWNPFQIMTK
jgi:Na+/H+ antiporter NhaD/arsenite permease-like protein